MFGAFTWIIKRHEEEYTAQAQDIAKLITVGCNLGIFWDPTVNNFFGSSFLLFVSLSEEM